MSFLALPLALSLSFPVSFSFGAATINTKVYRTFVSHKAKRANIATTAEYTNEQNAITNKRFTT